MTTAIDSSVLIAILKGEPGAEAWVRTLAHARAESRLVICDAVYAESSQALDTRDDFEAALTRLGIEFDPVQAAAAYFAGEIFAAYRKGGGPRQHLIPDFLIGAHAQVQAGRLAAIDRGYLRRYFPGLTLLSPSP